MAQDWTEPNVCLDENIGIDPSGLPIIQPWAVPRVVRDVKALSGGDGKLFAIQTLPGKLLINQRTGWRNETPLPHMVLIRVIRDSKRWIVSNPNAVQFRDRWTFVTDTDDLDPSEPVTTGIYNSQVGSAIDLGTNSVAEPNPGKHWVWTSVTCDDEWVGRPVQPGERFNLHYRMYVWTPPPFSDNANKNKPDHQAYGGWARIQLWAFPMQGNLVTG